MSSSREKFPSERKDYPKDAERPRRSWENSRRHGRTKLKSGSTLESKQKVRLSWQAMDTGGKDQNDSECFVRHQPAGGGAGDGLKGNRTKEEVAPRFLWRIISARSGQ